MVRGLISFAVAGIAVIVQVTIVNRIVFLGGAGPDLVLIAVAALALASGPLVGSLTGFLAGLALDVAPPGSHYVGQNALVFCLVGYACGLAVETPTTEGVPEQGHTALFEIIVTAAGAVCGEILASLLGVVLSDPRVTWPAVKHVLPAALAYDVVLSPFVLYACAAALRLAPGRAPEGVQPLGARAVAAARPPGPTPRLRLAERRKGEGLGGSVLGQGTGGSRGLTTAKREPRLKLGNAGSLGAGALGSAFTAGGARRGSVPGGTAAGSLGGAAKVRFSSRRGEGLLGGDWGGLAGTSRAVNSPLARSRLNSSRFGRSRMGRSLLGGSVFSRSPSALRKQGSLTTLAKPAPIGRSAFGGHSPFLRSPGRYLAGGGRSGVLGRLASALRKPARSQPRLRPQKSAARPAIGGKTPGRGWLRGSSSRRGTMGRSLAGTPRLGTGPARLHMPRPRAKKRWRTGGYR
jgi:rod shape-determining protein MreD